VFPNFQSLRLLLRTGRTPVLLSILSSSLDALQGPPVIMKDGCRSLTSLATLLGTINPPRPCREAGMVGEAERECFLAYPAVVGW